MIREFQNEYRWLSNFAPCFILLDGTEYSSVERAYMSAKNDTHEWKRFCQNAKSNGEVKREGRKIKLCDNWDNKKISVMRECLLQKFNQEPYKSKLIATKNLHIQEGNLWGDKFWGVCLKTSKGENNLGKLIMEIRVAVQPQNTDTPPSDRTTP